MAEKRLKDFTEKEEQELVEMVDYYKTGKRMFWIVISCGMIAGAFTAVIMLFKQFGGNDK